MGIFEAAVADFAEYDDIMKAIKAGKNITLSGVIDAAKEHLQSALTKDKKAKLIVTYDETRARQMVAQLKYYGENAVFYPAKDVIFFNADIHGNLIVGHRMEAIKLMAEADEVPVVTTVDGLCDRVLPLEAIKSAVIDIDMQSVIDIDKLKQQLIYIGYERTSEVEHPGQFAVRGSIVDVF